jgi:hypothetical protein
MVWCHGQVVYNKVYNVQMRLYHKQFRNKKWRIVRQPSMLHQSRGTFFSSIQFCSLSFLLLELKPQ